MRPRIRLDVLVTVFVGLVGILYFAGHSLAASPTLIRYQVRTFDCPCNHVSIQHYDVLVPPRHYSIVVRELPATYYTERSRRRS